MGQSRRTLRSQLLCTTRNQHCRVLVASQAVDGVGAGGRGCRDAMKDCSRSVGGVEMGGRDSRDVLKDRSSCVCDETSTSVCWWRRKLLMASG